MKTTEEELAVIRYCHRLSAKENRTVGARETQGVRGRDRYVIAYLDTFNPFYKSSYGIPMEHREYDPEVVILAANSWEELWQKIQEKENHNG